MKQSSSLSIVAQITRKKLKLDNLTTRKRSSQNGGKAIFETVTR